MSETPASTEWIFQSPFAEETEPFLALAASVAGEFGLELEATRSPANLIVLRAAFGQGLEAEERGRAFWLELHGRCLDCNLALEMVEAPPSGPWRPLSALPEQWRPTVQGQASSAASGFPPAGGLAPLAPASLAESASEALVPERPVITTDTIYDVLRHDDPELDRNLDETIAWIENTGMPVINLLSYLELPMFQAYAQAHEDEREQNLYLHMLHTWTCYRHYGALCASISSELAEAFTDPRFLRLSSNQFRAPSPALCLQLPAWALLVRGPQTQWAKEIYLTYCPPPTPAEDPELTLMIVTHDQQGEFGFIPLEVPLSLPGIGESIDAFFEPGLDDSELGGNSEDLRRLTVITATYCLYATAGDRTPYLPR